MEKKLISDHGRFYSYDGQQRAANGEDSWGRFSGMCRALDGWMLARAPASPVQGLYHDGLGYFDFAYFHVTCGLVKLELVDQNRLERDFSALLLRTLAMGRQQQSESIEVALDME